MFVLGARAHDYGKHTPEELLEKIGADGWQTVQLAFKKAVTGVAGIEDITPDLLRATNEAQQKAGVGVGVLGAYIEPSLVDDAQREKQVVEFIAHIPVAKAVNAGCIGTETTNMANQPGVERKQALGQLRRSLESILPVAQQQGVLVAVEPVHYHAMATPQDVADLLKDMQSEYLGMIFDPVNILSPAYVNNQYALWEQVFEMLPQHIKAVHIKGVKLEEGKMVSCPLEESIVDYAWIFDRLKKLPQIMPVLREEVKPEYATQDLRFMQALMG